MTNDQHERPVSTILGDRLCVKCAYNLRGQPVLQEPHYGLLLARCPECNTPAALQEYPLLGRWPARIRVLVALIYALVGLAALGATCGIIAGASAGLGSIGSGEASWRVAQMWADHVNAEEALGNTPLAGAPPFVQTNRNTEGLVVASEWMLLDRIWWESRRGEFFTRSIPETALHIIAQQPWAAAAVTVPFFVMGAIWATYLLGARRRALLLCCPIPVAIVALLTIAFNNESAGFGTWVYSNHLVEDATFFGAIAAVGALWIVFAGLGLVLGRPLARLAVRALLPPTLRGALAELWFTDGLPLPASTRAPRRLHPEINPPTAAGEANHDHIRHPH